MDIVAVLAIRDERPYLANCLRHLVENGLSLSVVDNSSTDGSKEILYGAEFSKHLVGFYTHPFSGHFDWKGLMEARETAASESGADWVLFVSADEVMHSFIQTESLAQSIARIARTGADAIDFAEFVFLPVDCDYASDIRGWQALRHYYFFEPRRPRLMRARRRTLGVSHVEAGGHVYSGEDFRLAEEQLALRHYLFRDQAHALRKYAERVFRSDELARGWHANRHNIETRRLQFPAAGSLDVLERPDSRDLSRARRHVRHYWEWDDREAG